MSISTQLEHLTHDIETSFEKRRAEASDVAKETRQTLQQFHQEHHHMSGDLHRSLASDRARRTGQVHDLLSRLNSERRGKRSSLRSELFSFQEERKRMAASMRSDLASFQRHLHETVDATIGGFSADRRQAHAHWENMTRAMAAKRASK